jgi:hypothetical protein
MLSNNVFLLVPKRLLDGIARVNTRGEGHDRRWIVLFARYRQVYNDWPRSGKTRLPGTLHRRGRAYSAYDAAE